MVRFRSRVPSILAAMVGFIALWQLFTVLFLLFRTATRPVRHYLNDYYFWFPTANLAWVVALTLLAGALAVRKRIAWLLLLVVVLSLVVNNIGFLMEGDRHAWGGLAYQLLVLGLMALGYPLFAARVRRGAWAWAVLILLVGYAVSFAIGFALVRRFPGTLANTDDEILWVLHQLLGGVGDVSPIIDGRGPFPLVILLGFLGAAVLIGAAVLAFRSVRAANTMTARDDELLRTLIDQYATEDSLAYFATRRDKAVVFSADGHAAVTYRVEAGVCLASADPIGDPVSWGDAITGWLALSRRYGWVPAVMGASEPGARAYADHGLDVLSLGDEARLATGELNLRGPDRAELRQAIARARRSGITVRIRRHHDVPGPELAAIGRLLEQWRDTESERGFSMALGRWGSGGDGECLLVEAITEDDEVVAVLSFVPWGRSGVSLDVMRHGADAPNGTTELMVAELCKQGEGLGLTRVSLNFAVFRSVFQSGAELGAGPLLRLWRRILVFASRWWQLESLYRANDKYRPTWIPRYLAYAERSAIPRIGLAAAIAEGFVKVPFTRNKTAGLPDSLAPIDPHEVRAPIAPATVRRPEQVRVRIAKAEQLLADGIDPWPIAEVPTHTAATALAAPPGDPVAIAGRVTAVRELGGVAFWQVRDWSGSIQVLWDAERIGAERMQELEKLVDPGDLIQVHGVRGVSRSGEESILGDSARLNAKSLHPIPDKRRGLVDPEARVRLRHLDLATNDRARDLTRARSAVLASLRTTLYEHGYAEVETPILQQIHGGANARPFETHINAYDLDLYLRIAPELYLKRLCVGGMERVFELGRAFRNEGVDFSHNPEFTLLEAYEAHGDYHSMRRLCQELIQKAAIAANGACVVPDPDGNLIDISGDWPVITLHEAVSGALLERGGAAVTVESSVEELREQCRIVDVDYRPGWDGGELALELYEHLVEDTTTVPTFYCDYPLSVSPLTRSHRSVPGLTERWDLVAWGMELGTAYSELTDPLEQRRRLTDQSLKAADGDPEAMELDEDFLTALEFGMPPTGGLGIGVDRLVMLVTGGSIRETLPFAMVKPKD